MKNCPQTNGARVEELEAKWEGGHIQNWSLVMNQLLVDDQLKDRVLKYI